TTAIGRRGAPSVCSALMGASGPTPVASRTARRADGRDPTEIAQAAATAPYHPCMDLNPQSVADAQFRIVRKGYDPEQVRPLLAQAAESLRNALTRATTAEGRVGMAEGRASDAETRAIEAEARAKAALQAASSAQEAA